MTELNLVGFKILVTGGAGFIGSELVHQLSEAGANNKFCLYASFVKEVFSILVFKPNIKPEPLNSSNTEGNSLTSSNIF